MNEQWSDETERLVVNAIAEVAILRAGPREFAEAALTALANAGLLLPPDIDENRQYGRVVPNGRVIPTSLPDPTHYRLNGRGSG